MNWFTRAMQKTANNFMTIDDVRAEIAEGGGLYKYVRIGGQYRFAKVTITSMDHRALAQDEPVESAASISVHPWGMKIEGYSSTLGIGPDAKDYEILPQLLGLPLLENY